MTFWPVLILTKLLRGREFPLLSHPDMFSTIHWLLNSNLFNFPHKCQHNISGNYIQHANKTKPLTITATTRNHLIWPQNDNSSLQSIEKYNKINQLGHQYWTPKILNHFVQTSAAFCCIPWSTALLWLFWSSFGVTWHYVVGMPMPLFSSVSSCPLIDNCPLPSFCGGWGDLVSV